MLNDDDFNPLAKYVAIEVPVLYECKPDTDHPLTVEEIYDSWASILTDSPYPLLVSGYMLVDQVRIIDGEIAGHLVCPDDNSEECKTWIKMAGHCVQRITGIGPTKGQLHTDEYSPVFQFRCFWCGNSRTYASTKLAFDEGWKTLYDPLGNNIEFCPCQECQDMYLSYMELYQKVKDCVGS